MNEDKILQKLAEHDARLDRLEEKMDQMVTKDEFNAKMDKVLTILGRLDQERIFTQEWIHRIEADVEKIKRQLHIA